MVDNCYETRQNHVSFKKKYFFSKGNKKGPVKNVHFSLFRKFLPENY
jgi:hypothetical protein